MISQKIEANLRNSSWIRAMFEQGSKLNEIYGPENVFDYSLGNPDYEPPTDVVNSIKKHVAESEKIHQYMSNAGYSDVRLKLSQKISGECNLDVSFENIVMTCGAAGGLNVVLKTILNQDDEVLVFSPHFPEYGFYIDNHNGKCIQVNSDKQFLPDLIDFEKKINKNSKAVIINSPNNPTGVIYSKEILNNLAKVIEKKEKELNIKLLVISDEPYTQLIYDGLKIPHTFNHFNNSLIINSYSKSLALAGERIGYIAVNPKTDNIGNFMSGLIFSNRILGYVNAPSLFQKVVGDTVDIEFDNREYLKRRNFLYENLIELGYDCVKPDGAFYLFPKTPIPDDVEFVKRALKYNLLLVPGSGFGGPGHVRIAYCINFEKIKRSIESFRKLALEYNLC
jgi:aspartate aminotransferase